MKKRVFSIVTLLVLLLVTVVTIYAANNEEPFFGMHPYHCSANSGGHYVPTWTFDSECHSGYHMSHYQQYHGTCSYCNRNIINNVFPGCTDKVCVMVGK